ncbi:MAG TPA: Gfo/Idh/MocA family oxidoreductase [Gemmatimonadaceae bacterium]
MSNKKTVTRRDFVADAGKVALGAMIVPNGFPTIVPRHVLGGRGFTPPSALLNIGVVGVGGQGSGNARSVASENLVAFCDVDPAFMERNVMGTDGSKPPTPDTIAFRDKYHQANKYTDFREMLAKQRDLDAVIVATPDHMHATVAAAAMRAGKHVYCQKPLTYSVYESRLLSRLARENKVVTQMGNQGHSGDGTRRVVEWVRAGVIGQVREVHIYTDRPARFWAQGLPRPGAAGSPATLSAGNVRAVSNALAAAMANANPTMPEGLRWDLYLGPVAEDISYHPIYHPFTWRGWTDFGVGALGDMGAHLIDQAYWSLGLTYPTSIEATSSLWGTESVPPPAGSPPGTRPASKPVSYPMASTVHYQFPAVGSRAAVKLNWYDGGLFPPRPDGLPDEVKLDSEGGGIFVGDKGILIHNTYGENPRLFPMSVAQTGAEVPQTLPRIAESHQMNWVRACKGETQASSPFEYGAALNETMVLGVAALRAGQGRKVVYDGEKMQFTNAPDANQFLTREYRAGWAL